MTVHLPAVANDRQLSGQALLAVDAGKLLGGGYRVAIHGDNDVAHLQPQLPRDTTGWCSFDQNSAARVGTQPTGNFCSLALIRQLMDIIRKAEGLPPL